ncbi:inner-membrane translocator [Thermincola ferriacetica]|uniref:Inner-membrane translocator n=1 Tax=Thermincola ferriacetica TaxID=281456 RepID=A0A0L6W099_9FIRM|nr:urea ABC transporter permease subunit UrtB [Thermincola ferriacetica]KNZ68935.1 inner-membrane translocator [Thermincola ferriacetica]
MDTLLLQIFNGISVSSILLLIALGLSITFGLMNVINMAHGELIMIGAYVAYVTQLVFSRYLPKELFGLYFIVAIPLAFAVTGLLGLLLENVLIRFLYGRPLDSLLATWGVSMILQQLARNIFGAPNVDVVSPQWLNGGLQVTAGLQLPYKRLFIIGLVLICVAGIYLFFYRSGYGRKIRAVMQNRNMASCLGVPTRKVDSYTFALGSGLAGIAGCTLTLLGSIGPTLGTYYIVDAFMVVVLGGVGKIIGTVAGALAIGILNTALEYSTTASIGKVLVFAIVIAFLQLRPAGLFSIRTRALD